MPAPTPVQPAAPPAGHDVIVGYGRVGSLIGARLAAAGHRLVVFEEREEAVAAARADGAMVLAGNAADPEVLGRADLAAARRLFVTIPEAFEAGQVVLQARVLNPGLEILARAHSEEAVRHLDGLGASLVILGEREIAERMIERALPSLEARAAAQDGRAGPGAAGTGMTGVVLAGARVAGLQRERSHPRNVPGRRGPCREGSADHRAAGRPTPTRPTEGALP